MLALLSMVGFVLWIYSVVWIYNDEEGGSATLWAVLTAIFTMIPLLIYGITRRSRPALLLTAAWIALPFLSSMARGIFH